MKASARNKSGQYSFLAALAFCLLLFVRTPVVYAADAYTAPTIHVPYATAPPIINGTINDAEWQGAVSLNALQTTNRAVSARQARFWMLWDTDTIYLAMRSPFRPGERPIQAMRELDHDLNVVFDDSYEIWLDVSTRSPDGEPVYFQYLSNIAGARYDVMFEPAVGNSRLNWTANWKTRNRVTPDGHFWEMEMAIPRRSLYRNTPFTDGFTFRGLLARNFKRPWEQVTLAGTGSFSVRETYATFVLDKTAPAIHLLSVGDPTTGKFGLRLAAESKRAQTLRWSFTSDGGVQRQGDLPLQPGKSVEPANAPDLAALDTTGTGSFRIHVEDSSGRTYLDWSASRQWGDGAALQEKLNDTGDSVDLALQLNPVRDYVRVNGDFINYDTRANISRYRADVRDSKGNVIAAKELHLDSLAYVRDILPIPHLAPGTYTARLTAYGKAGNVLLTREKPFVKKDPAREFAWWKTSLGNADKVLAPWIPVRYQGGKLDVWGRTTQIGAAGLPRQIRSQGRDLLSGPTRLIAGWQSGKETEASSNQLKTVSQADHRVIVAASSTLGTLAVRSNVTAEYDGMVKIDLIVSPQRTTPVRFLKVVIPLRAEVASYLHASGEGIRYGFDYRFLPTGKNKRVWDSRKVDGQPMRVGSFIPYLWVGDSHGGLCWFADSDAGWTPSNKMPAIEIQRDAKGNANLILNIISRAETLKTPRHITFAFQATPVKPLRSGWRMDSWWTNDSFQDWAQIESKGKVGNMGLIFSSLPFPLDPTVSRQMVTERHKQTNAHIFGFDKYKANAVPYFEHINMGAQFVPEMDYFEDEWRTHVSRGLSYGPTLTDFMIYNVSNWIKSSDIDGFYIDNVYPIADNTIAAGRGYRLPNGQIQPTYQMFDTRRYLLRLRAAFAEQGKSGKIVLHITNNLILPWVGAADIALDGEDHVIYPEMQKDFMDFWSLERMRIDYPGQWGVPVNFLQEYQGNWDNTKLKKVMRAYTGIMLLQDVLASANANGMNPEVWIARNQFGMEQDDIQFLPYWESNAPQSQTSGVYASAWRHTRKENPHRLLVTAVNTGEKAQAILKVPPALLGSSLATTWIVRDAETGEQLPSPYTSGLLKFPIERHDYRQILIMEKTP